MKVNSPLTLFCYIQGYDVIFSSSVLTAVPESALAATAAAAAATAAAAAAAAAAALGGRPLRAGFLGVVSCSDRGCSSSTFRRRHRQPLSGDLCRTKCLHFIRREYQEVHCEADDYTDEASLILINPLHENTVMLKKPIQTIVI